MDFMGGNDYFDELRLCEHYSLELTLITTIWWYKLVYAFFDMSATNAFICWKFFHPEATHARTILAERA